MLNIAIMTGRLVADPEITVVGANQNQKCAFRIAVPRRFKTENGPDSDFINVVAWNSRADFVGKHFHKGKWINVLGPLVTRTWEKDGQKYYGFEISACIGISLVAGMLMASLDGTLVPIFFKKIGIDPAVASGPLITTLNDLIAVCVYYGVSLLLFVQIGLFH